MSARALLPVGTVPRAAGVVSASCERQLWDTWQRRGVTAFQCLLVSADVRCLVPEQRHMDCGPHGCVDIGEGRASLPVPLPQVAMVSEACFVPACPSLQAAVPRFREPSPRGALSAWACPRRRVRCSAGPQSLPREACLGCCALIPRCIKALFPSSS